MQISVCLFVIWQWKISFCEKQLYDVIMVNYATKSISKYFNLLFCSEVMLKINLSENCLIISLIIRFCFSLQNKITDADGLWEQIYFYFVSCTERFNLQFTNNWPGSWSKWLTAQDDGLQFNPPDPHTRCTMQLRQLSRLLSGIQFSCKSVVTEYSLSKHKFTKNLQRKQIFSCQNKKNKESHDCTTHNKSMSGPIKVHLQQRTGQFSRSRFVFVFFFTLWITSHVSVCTVGYWHRLMNSKQMVKRTNKSAWFILYSLQHFHAIIEPITLQKAKKNQTSTSSSFSKPVSFHESARWRK